MLNILRIIFEWFIVLAIVYGVISDIIYEYTVNHILAITPIAIPLLVGSVWVYVKITGYFEERKKRQQEINQRQDY